MRVCDVVWSRAGPTVGMVDLSLSVVRRVSVVSCVARRVESSTAAPRARRALMGHGRTRSPKPMATHTPLSAPRCRSSCRSSFPPCFHHLASLRVSPLPSPRTATSTHTPHTRTLATPRPDAVDNNTLHPHTRPPPTRTRAHPPTPCRAYTSYFLVSREESL